jgi:peroxiredoxin
MSNKRVLSKYIVVVALAFFGGSLVAQSAASPKPWYTDGLQKLGFTVFKKLEPVDDVELRALGGGASRLSDQKGKVVILNFWATWCPPCRAEMPALDKLWQKDKSLPFTILGVSVGEEVTVVKDFIAKNGYGYPIYVDPSGRLGAMFGARSIPTTYILDKSGNVIAGKVGGADYDSPEAVALFAELATR